MQQKQTIRNCILFVGIYLIAFTLNFYPVIVNGLLIAIIFFITGNINEIGLTKESLSWRNVGIALLLAIAVNLAAKIILIPLSDYITNTERDLSRFENLRGNPMALLNFLPYIWLSAAFGEEMIFRGFILTQFPLVKLNVNINPVWGLLFSSLLFGLGHWYQGLSGMLFTGMMGIIIGLIFLKSQRNLVLCMLIHGFFDTLSGLMYVYKWDLLFQDLY